ncbi:phage tail protein [Tenacibaculum sp. S7007]|uniref:Phage tail protein n=1 Tax=Tenacibaculum pelagium TaxID=2759527 RepID=A0A839AMC2_9FLAO|nr:tail fiber protein [Tenacibaculum pelagium]MBA6155606.1 phage tail protein [Tenacibaculum pelagium]
MKLKTTLLGGLLLILLSISDIYAQQEGFLGEVKMFAGNFAPRGWAFCDGQLLAISQNTALFSILGTTYGGDGRTTFALPDLRGRVSIGPRRGPGLTDYRLGQKGGIENVILNITQIPSHSHNAVLSATAPVGRGEGTTSPTGNYNADGGSYASTKNTQMASDAVTIGNTGGNLSHENRPPYIAINYIICTQGLFPSRN